MFSCPRTGLHHWLARASALDRHISQPCHGRSHFLLINIYDLRWVLFLENLPTEQQCHVPSPSRCAQSQALRMRCTHVAQACCPHQPRCCSESGKSKESDQDIYFQSPVLILLFKKKRKIQVFLFSETHQNQNQDFHARKGCTCQILTDVSCLHWFRFSNFK